ncbi:MAG: hypothetical protein N4A62_14875 [Marinisporobacter sp.]|nr:hypothetical protein [Marinisporobacter sp.]
MKKNRIFYTIYALLILCMIVTLFIVYKDIKHPFAYKFVIGSVIFLFLFFFYLVFRTTGRLITLKSFERRKRIRKFIISFVLLYAFLYGTDYFFRPSKVDSLRACSHAFGYALGISFFDLVFLKKREY